MAGNSPFPGRNCRNLGGFSSAQELGPFPAFTVTSLASAYQICPQPPPPTPHRQMGGGGEKEGALPETSAPALGADTFSPHLPKVREQVHFFLRQVTQWLMPQLLNTQPPKPRWGPVHKGDSSLQVHLCISPHPSRVSLPPRPCSPRPCHCVLEVSLPSAWLCAEECMGEVRERRQKEW